MAVTNLTGANMNLTTQVAEYSNQLSTKDSAMATMQEKIIHLQGGIKTLKRKLSGQTTKRPPLSLEGARGLFVDKHRSYNIVFHKA